MYSLSYWWLCSVNSSRLVLKKDRTFTINNLFYNILSTVPFKAAPSTGDTQFPTFLPFLERFLERTFCDGVQFSYRIFPKLRVFKKRPNFLNGSPTSTEGALRILSSSSSRFWQQTAIFTSSCASAQFSGCSSTANVHSETGQIEVCCQNLPLGALAVVRPLCWLARYLKSSVFFWTQVYS